MRPFNLKQKELNKILISICHIKTISFGIVSETYNTVKKIKETEEIRFQSRARAQSSEPRASRLFIFLNSICRVFLLLNSLKLYLCNLSFLTFLPLLTRRNIEETERKSSHSFHLVCYTYRPLVCPLRWLKHISLESILMCIGELLNIVMICFVTLFFRMGISSVNVWINVWEIVFWWRMNGARRRSRAKNHGHMNEKEEKLWIWKQMADDWDLFSSVRFKLIPIDVACIPAYWFHHRDKIFWKYRD